MIKQRIEDIIGEVLIGDTQKNALAFVAFMRANEMLFERGGGYWEDKFYFMAKYLDEFVCFILVGDPENRGFPWTVWSDASDSSNSQWYESASPDERTKETAFQNVDFCGHCSPNSPCYGGMSKIIFGKKFDNVCRTTFRFDNPSVEALECLKKMVEIRKSDILKST